MMRDFVTLTCPSCGGILEVLPNTLVFECDHCGNTHQVNREIQDSIESSGHCPRCLKNDRTEKLSSILASHTHQLEGNTVSETSYQDKDGNWYTTSSTVPFSGTQTSTLAQKLSPPSKPKLKSNYPAYSLASFIESLALLFALFCVGSLSLAIIMSIAILGQGLYNGSANAILGGILGILVEIIIGAFLMVVYTKKYLPKQKEAKKQKEAELKIEIGEWNNAMFRWDQLYYCYRDGIVFVPFEKQIIPINDLRAYINKN
jgi:uncharacterized membrane protein required for colicin V production